MDHFKEKLNEEKLRAREQFEPSLWCKAKTDVSRNEEDVLCPFTNWDYFLPKNEQFVDIHENPCPKDERLTRYKGIYNRMGQNQINDPFGTVEGPMFGEDLFKASIEAMDDADLMGNSAAAAKKAPGRSKLDVYSQRSGGGS